MPETAPLSMSAFWDSLKHLSVNLKNTTERPDPQVGPKFGAVVPTVGLSNDCKIAVPVIGEMCVECLHKRPYDLCSFGRRLCTLVAVAEAGADRLVNVKHVGVIIPTVRIQHGCRSRDVVEGAWAILLEEANHAATTRTTSEP
jgi:hypothetical protein